MNEKNQLFAAFGIITLLILLIIIVIYTGVMVSKPVINPNSSNVTITLNDCYQQVDRYDMMANRCADISLQKQIDELKIRMDKYESNNP